MFKSYLVSVDPRELRLPPSRRSGADPVKLQRQMVRHGTNFDGMPPPWAYLCSDGRLLAFDGVTRATRSAKLRPGIMIDVLIIGRLAKPGQSLPRVGDFTP